MGAENCPITSDYFVDEFDNAGSGNWSLPADVVQGAGFIGVPDGIGSGRYVIPLLFPMPDLIASGGFIDVTGDFTVTGAWGVIGLSQGSAWAGFEFGSGAPIIVEFLSAPFDYNYSYRVSGGAVSVANTFFNPPISVEDYNFSFSIRARLTATTYVIYVNGTLVGSGSMGFADYGPTKLVISKLASIIGETYPGIRCDRVYIYGSTLVGTNCVGPALELPPYPYCQLGKSYYYDAPVLFDDNFWTRTLTLEIGATDDVMIVSGMPPAYRTTKNISDYTNYALYKSAMVSTKKTFSEFRATADLFQTVYSAGGGGGSSEAVVLRIESGPVVRLWQKPNDSQFFVTVHHYNTGPTLMYSNSNLLGTSTKEVRVLQDGGDAGIFSVYVDNILIVDSWDVLSTGFGPRTIHMESVFRAALYGPGLIYGHQSSGQWRNLYLIGTGLPSECLGESAGQSPADGSQGGLTPYLSWFPQASATAYQIQIFRDIDMVDLALDKTVSVTHLDLVEQAGFIGFPLDFNLTFYWRIRAFKGQAAQDWSPLVSYRPEDALLSFNPILNHVSRSKGLLLQQFKGGS